MAEAGPSKQRARQPLALNTVHQVPIPQNSFHASKLGELARGPWPSYALAIISATTSMLPTSRLLLRYDFRIYGTILLGGAGWMSKQDWYHGAKTASLISSFYGLLSFTKAGQLRQRGANFRTYLPSIAFGSLIWAHTTLYGKAWLSTSSDTHMNDSF